MPEKSDNKFKVIQQWDYFNKDWPELKNEDYMKYCADHGVTSLQSYVYWASVEKKRGEFSFEYYDDIVERMTKYGLKWTPFIIAGPDYATPDWFHDSKECVYAKCLEHCEESRIQSIWNPNILKYVEVLMSEVAGHFSSDVIESVLLGMSGNWGESIYPVGGGFNFKQKPFHTHLGWWCGDENARANFRVAMSAKYGDVKGLNERWGTSYKSLDDLTFPSRYRLKVQRYVSRLLSIAADRYDNSLTNILENIYLKYLVKKKKGRHLRRLGDFVDWYISSMSNYSEKWLRIARKCFPNNEIYLVTGGDGNPMIGADFTEQAKVAKKFDAGIRITNQTDDYAESYAMTRWTATAARHYAGYFTTEEALYNSYDGIKMRLLDAATSGACGAYFKTILDCTLTDNCELKIKGKGEGGNVIENNLSLLRRNCPATDIALLLPTTSIRSVPFSIKRIYKNAMKLKKNIDMDFVCEDMIADGLLNKYKKLSISHSAVTRPKTKEIIAEWQKMGGQIVADRGAKLYGL